MSTTQSFEDVEAKYETDETPESHLLLVHIPHGFAREHIGAKIEYDFKRVRVSGERPLKDKMARFNVIYKVPEYCDINRIRGKFDGKTVTITMQKDPEKVLNQDPQPSEQEETEPKPENGKEGTPQSEIKNDDQEKTSTGDDHVPKSTIESKDDTPPTPPKATQESMPQKGKDGISHEATVTKFESTELPKGATPSLPPRDKSEEQAGHETSNPPEATQETMPEKGKDGISHKAINAMDAKLQTEEIADENDKEKQRVMGKEESKDNLKKTLETRKSLQESKGIGTVESFSTKDVAKKKSDEKAKPESTTSTRIKEVAASASQAVTNLAKRFNDEDKQRLIYMGAAVLVVALGAYATYKLRSSRRI